MFLLAWGFSCNHWWLLWQLLILFRANWALFAPNSYCNKEKSLSWRWCTCCGHTNVLKTAFSKKIGDFLLSPCTSSNNHLQFVKNSKTISIDRGPRFGTFGIKQRVSFLNIKTIVFTTSTILTTACKVNMKQIHWNFPANNPKSFMSLLSVPHISCNTCKSRRPLKTINIDMLMMIFYKQN